jgi:hypothetical protein
MTETALTDRITAALVRRGFTPYDPAEDPRRTFFLVEEEGAGAVVSLVWDRATDQHQAIALDGYEGVLTAHGLAVEYRGDHLYVTAPDPTPGQEG